MFLEYSFVPDVLAAFGSRRRNRTPLLGRLQETLEHLHKRVTGGAHLHHGCHGVVGAS